MEGVRHHLVPDPFRCAGISPAAGRCSPPASHRVPGGVAGAVQAVVGLADEVLDGAAGERADDAVRLQAVPALVVLDGLLGERTELGVHLQAGAVDVVETALEAGDGRAGAVEREAARGVGGTGGQGDGGGRAHGQGGGAVVHHVTLLGEVLLRGGGEGATESASRLLIGGEE